MNAAQQSAAPVAALFISDLHLQEAHPAIAAAFLTLSSEEIARLDALEVAGEKEIELGHNWFDGVTPPLR